MTYQVYLAVPQLQLGLASCLHRNPDLLLVL